MGNNLKSCSFPRCLSLLAILRSHAHSEQLPSQVEIIAPLWTKADAAFGAKTGFQAVTLQTIPMTITGGAGEGALTLIVKAQPETLIPIWPKYYDHITGSLVIANKGFRVVGINPAEPRDDRVGVAGAAAAHVMEVAGPELLAMNPDRITLLNEALEPPVPVVQTARDLALPARAELEQFIDASSFTSEPADNLRVREFRRAIMAVLEEEIGSDKSLEGARAFLVENSWDEDPVIGKDRSAIDTAVQSVAEIAARYGRFVSTLGVRNSAIRFAATAPFSISWDGAQWKISGEIDPRSSFGVCASQDFQKQAVDADSPTVREMARKFRSDYDGAISKLDTLRASMVERMRARVSPCLAWAREEATRKIKAGSLPDSVYLPTESLQKALASTRGSQTLPLHNTDAALRLYDLVELTKAAPLSFANKVIRNGAAGERFQIIQVRPAEGRAFLLSTDLNGTEIAVGVDQAALRFVDLADNQIATKLRVLASDPTIDRAMAFLNQVVSNRPDLDRWKQMRRIGEDLNSSRSAALEYRKRAATNRSEALRIRKNAAVTDRPDPLIAGGTSANAGRAANMRQKAEEFEAAAERATSQAIASESEASALQNSFREFPTR